MLSVWIIITQYKNIFIVIKHIISFNWMTLLSCYNKVFCTKIFNNYTFCDFSDFRPLWPWLNCIYEFLSKFMVVSLNDYITLNICMYMYYWYYFTLKCVARYLIKSIYSCEKQFFVINHVMGNIRYRSTIQIVQDVVKSFKYADLKMYLLKIVFWKYNESSHRFTFSSVLFCYTCIHAFQARVVEYYVSCNNYTLQPQDNIYNMNRYQEHSVTAINWISNLKSKTLIYIVIEGKSYHNIAYNIIVLMCNCIFINDGLLIAAHYKQLFSKYVTYFISHCHITYIRLYSTVILCIVKKLYNMFTHRWILLQPEQWLI